MSTSTSVMAEAGTQTLSAASKVMHITELLENILIYLPCDDLILVQRVSSTWQAIITSNKIIQTALCFAPSEERHDKHDVEPNQTISLPNFWGQPEEDEHSGRVDPCMFATDSAQEFYAEIAPCNEARPLLNPLLGKLFECSRHFTSDRTYTCKRPDWSNPFALDRKVKGSFQSMHLMQPPATVVDLYPAKLDRDREERSITLPTTHSWRRLWNETGVTIKDLRMCFRRFAGSSSGNNGIVYAIAASRMLCCVDEKAIPT